LTVNHYVIRVEGRLSAATASAFPAMAAKHQTQTVLHGGFDDQRALGGVLSRLRSLGIDVVEIHRLPLRTEPRLSQARADN
jgi:hypothetical protein